MKKQILKKSLLVLSSAALLSGTVLAQDSLYRRSLNGERPVISIGDVGTVTINKAAVDFRYRIDDSQLADQLQRMQSSGIMDVTVSVFEDKVALNIAATTGSGFGSTFDDTGLLDGEEDLNLNIRRLSIVLKPNNKVEVEVGSMAVDNGMGSENTGIEESGYIMGYRAKVKFEKGELVVTGGFLGDFNNPNVFDRDTNLWDTDDFNYVSAMFNHQIGKIITASIGATIYDDDNYFHGAMKLDTRQWISFLDSVSVEGTVMDSDDHEDLKAIYGVTLAKRFENAIGTKDLELALSYLHADEGLRLPRGSRALDGDSVDVRVKLPNLVEARHYTIGLYAGYTHSLEDTEQSRFEAGVSINF